MAALEPIEASNEKSLLVDFIIIGARHGADDTADRFAFIDLGGPSLPDDGLGTFDSPPTNQPNPSPAANPVFENNLLIDAHVDPMAEDMLLFSGLLRLASPRLVR